MNEQEWIDTIVEFLCDVHALQLEVAAGIETDLEGRIEHLGDQTEQLIYCAGNFRKCCDCGRAMNDCGCNPQYERDLELPKPYSCPECGMPLDDQGVFACDCIPF